MRPRTPRRRQRCPPPVRLALLLLGLTLILAPMLDGATESGPWKAHTNRAPAQGLDLCAVPGLVSASLVTTPAQLASPLVEIPSRHLPSPLAQDRDHPPRPA